MDTARTNGPVAGSGGMATEFSHDRPLRVVPSFDVPVDGGPRSAIDPTVAIERMLHDVITQALFRAQLAASELAERFPSGSTEHDLAAEALEAIGAALFETHREIAHLRACDGFDGH